MISNRDRMMFGNGSQIFRTVVNCVVRRNPTLTRKLHRRIVASLAQFHIPHRARCHVSRPRFTAPTTFIAPLGIGAPSIIITGSDAFTRAFTRANHFMLPTQIFGRYYSHVKILSFAMSVSQCILYCDNEALRLLHLKMPTDWEGPLYM